MQTTDAADTQTLAVPDQTQSSLITPGDITSAFWAALGALEGIKHKVAEFSGKCAFAGKLLARKNKELGETRAAFEEYLSKSCPDISPATAYRLMAIHKRTEELSVSGGRLELPEGISSVRGLYEELTGAPETDPAPAPAKKSLPAPSKVKAAISVFWKVFAKRPVPKWSKDERVEFLEDTRERARLILENRIEEPGYTIRDDGVIEIHPEVATIS